jgi:hypothetical protein
MGQEGDEGRFDYVSTCQPFEPRNRDAALAQVSTGAILGDRFERSGRAEFDRVANGQSDEAATSSIIDRHLDVLAARK